MYLSLCLFICLPTISQEGKLTRERKVPIALARHVVKSCNLAGRGTGVQGMIRSGPTIRISLEESVLINDHEMS